MENNEVNIEQKIKKNEFLFNHMKKAILVSCEEIKEYIDDEHIEIKDNFKRSIVSVKLLKDLFDNKYFEYLKKLFNNEIDMFRISEIINGNIKTTITLSKTDIITALEIALNDKRIELDKKSKKRYESHSNLISMDSFIKKYSNKTHETIIDGNFLSIPVEDMINFVSLNDEKYNQFFDFENGKNINEIPKEYFVYAVFDFFKKEKILENYTISSDIKKRLYDIYNQKTIDTYALNRIKSTKDDDLHRVCVNFDLKNHILKDMPNNFNSLEKAIYIYIKMCKTLTYDDEYFAVNQKGEATLKHKNIFNIKNISQTNNKVVCFQFNAIYGKLLDELEIKFHTHHDNVYGDGHSNLTFRVDKFLITADSVNSMLHTDMMYSKINQPLKGITCNNKNQDTNKEFNTKVNEIYNLISKQESNDKNISCEKNEYIEEFDDILRKYQNIVPNNNDISLSQKLNLLMAKLNSTKMSKVDTVSYMMLLKKIIFSKEELADNIDITIVRSNMLLEKDKVATICSIITINESNIYTEYENNKYYLYNMQKNLKKISRENLEQMLYKKEIETIGCMFIPSIDYSGGKIL